MHTKVYLAIVFLFLILCSCKNKKLKDISEEPNVNNVLEQQRNAILGKKISSIVTILGDSINAENKVILLYDGYDCENCIDVGYEMSKRIDELSDQQKVYIITTSLNIGSDQIKNGYVKYVFYDEHDIIRKELKYIYTPVLLKLDTLEKVVEVFFPSYKRNEQLEDLFIKICT